MHRYSRALLAAAVLVVVGVLPVFASGQNESSRLSGMIASIQPASTPNMVTVTLSNKKGNVTVTVSQNVVTALSLKVGQSINVDGALHIGQDGMETIDPTDMEAGGKTLQIAQHETALRQQAVSHGGEQSSNDQSRPEQPEHEGGSSSHSSGSSHDH